VAVVTIDEPEKGNSLTEATLEGLHRELEASGSEGLQAVVITGSGSIFCSGGDMAALTSWHEWEPQERREYLEAGPHELGRVMFESSFATIAAVNGAAFGAGMDVALLCDVRLASSAARFSPAYVNVGLVPGDGGAWLLPRIVGQGRALELLLSGRVLEAPEALEWGVVTEVCQPDALVSRAVEVAGRLASRPPTARHLIRKLVFAGASQSWPEHLEAVAHEMAIRGGSDEHREAISKVWARKRSS
jgi:enoyl-CoA hydratase/carnithine racemase